MENIEDLKNIETFNHFSQSAKEITAYVDEKFKDEKELRSQIKTVTDNFSDEFVYSSLIGALLMCQVKHLDLGKGLLDYIESQPDICKK